MLWRAEGGDHVCFSIGKKRVKGAMARRGNRRIPMLLRKASLRDPGLGLSGFLWASFAHCPCEGIGSVPQRDLPEQGRGEPFAGVPTVPLSLRMVAEPVAEKDSDPSPCSVPPYQGL